MGKNSSKHRRLRIGNNNDDKLANALARGLRVRKKMELEEGGSISADETARLLGRKRESVLNLYHKGKVLGWKNDGTVRFPLWQFMKRQQLPGVREVLAKLNEGDVLDDWGKVGFFLLSHGLLDDRRPLDLLRDDKLEPVLKAAEAYGS